VDSGTLIAEVARRDGVLLDKGDPVLIVATALDVVMSEHRSALAEAAKPSMSDEQVRNIAGILVHRVDLQVAKRTTQLAMLAGAGVLCVGLLIGAAAAWWFFVDQNATLLSWGRAAMSQCQDAAVVDGTCHVTIRVR
jgi:hypothetical protein